jgi:hypothetical protein
MIIGALSTNTQLAGLTESFSCVKEFACTGKTDSTEKRIACNISVFIVGRIACCRFKFFSANIINIHTKNT